MANNQFKIISNEILWDRLRKSDQKAVEDLYRFNYQILYSYAFKICRDKELSKDCVQELFIQLWEKRDKLNKVSKVRSYLLQSIWHILIKELKKVNKNLPLDENEHYDINIVFSTESILNKNQSIIDNKKALKAAIDNLSTRQREIIFMQFYEGLSIDEIQQITELKYQSIKNLTYRAMISLRESFKLKKK